VTAVRDFTAASIAGKPVSLSRYDGKVLLIVNVASKCGFTSQYEGLQRLYRDRADDGLVVLGFPCDQFGQQEPGSEQEIAQFCSTTYGVSFPMFAKVDVNGDDAHPLYQWLRTEQGGVLDETIEWNFTKFLVGRDGSVIARYPPDTNPDDIRSDIDAALAA